MMTDAEHGLFDMVVVKDISRFARNTVDLLQNVRKLKSLGIETGRKCKYFQACKVRQEDERRKRTSS